MAPVLRPSLVYEIDGQRIVCPLDRDELTIGRAPDNDVVVNRQYVSRHHARLRRGGDGWHVVDLGSKCGTTINDLGHADKRLEHGDRILLQDFALTFLERPAPAAVEVASLPRSTVVALTGKRGAPELGMHTHYQNAVDFSRLATAAPDVVRLQKLLSVVADSSKSILSSRSLDETFQRVLDLVFEHLPVQRGFVMLWSDEQADLVARSVRHRTPVGGEEEIRFSRTIAERVYRDKVAVLTTDAQADGRFAAGESIIRLGIRSAIAAPIWHGERVEGLICADSSAQAKAFDRFDLDLLSALGNHLAIAIEQARLVADVMQQQLVRRKLERYHSPAVIDRIASGDASTEGDLVADERDVTLLFADVVGFTERCETLQPKEVASLLNRYFSEMTEAVFRHEGTLDKFIGDCLMAVFGAPLACDDHARRAVDAALDMREAMRRLNEPLAEAERVRFRVGVHSGRVVAGDIGSVRRRDYTVLGSTVNLAARLEAEVAAPGQIVLSESTARGVGDGYVLTDLGERRLRGLSSPVRCFELLEAAR
jgi:adenylate cyclase